MTHDLSHRRGYVDVSLTDAAGEPLVGADVDVEFARHDFGFGNIGFDFVRWQGGDGDPATSQFGGAGAETGSALAPHWLELYNMATLPFYWRGFEPVPGQPDTDRLKAVAQWLTDHDVVIKGHPLVWHTLAPQWLLDEEPAEVERLIRERIVREMTQFAGLIDLWDVVNEAVIMPVFTAEDNAVTRLVQRRSRMDVLTMAFETAREANPSARLVLNDFDLSADYERLIEECLEAGLPIDAIGLQTHMHQGYRGEAQVEQVLERFARFGLPLQMTETTLLSGELMPGHIVDLNDYQVDDWPSTPEGEERQADEIVRHYRTLFSHPAVESATYWGFADEGAWLNAPSGLVRRDGTLKPAFEALRSLIREEWWTPPRRATTDAAGVVRVEGFAGTYRLRVAGTEHRVTVDREDAGRISLAV